jgi:hypothetical protein
MTPSPGHASGLEAELQEQGLEPASLTIVIEWDNAKLCDVGRPLGMLRALYDQLREMQGAFRSRPEIRLVYDSAKTERAFIERLMSEATGGASWPADVVMLPESGLSYYDQKNRGALGARTDVVLFLDSDVMPEAEWLRSLVGSFCDPRVSVAGGSTHVALDGFLCKAFALFWFFPLREETNGLVETDSFFANNVAFRREVFEKFPFPEAAVYRGRCSLLAAELRDRGVPIFRNLGARVSHPPPKGISQFVLRAFREGRDEIVLLSLRPSGSARSVVETFLERIVWLPWAVLGRRERVQLGVSGALVSLGIGYVYYSVKLFGGFIAWIHFLGVRRMMRSRRRVAPGEA